MNPYKILGVQSDATDEVILRAYRKLAKRYHPDRNPGDEHAKDKYTEVDAAFKLLSDPIRRERYDRTGDVNEPRRTAVDPEHAELCQILQPLLIEVLQSLGSSPFGPHIKEVDVVERIKQRLATIIANAEQHRASVERGRATLTEVVGRFEVKNGENILADLVRSQLAQVESEFNRIKGDLDKLTRVKDYLRGVTYRKDGTPGRVRDLYTMLPWGSA